MKILEIKGDGDFAALQFEDDMGVDEAKRIIANGQKIESDPDDEELSYYGVVHEFGQVDKNFFNFVMNEIVDYDYAKHHNLYILED